MDDIPEYDYTEERRERERERERERKKERERERIGAVIGLKKWEYKMMR